MAGCSGEGGPAGGDQWSLTGTTTMSVSSASTTAGGPASQVGSTGTPSTESATGSGSGGALGASSSASSAGTVGSNGTVTQGGAATQGNTVGSTGGVGVAGTGAGGAAATSSSTTAGPTTGGAIASSGCGQPAETGTFQDSVEAFGLQRTFHLSIPESYVASLPQRLVFGYHGSNYTGQMMRQYLDLERPPLEDGTVFVYPDGIALDGQPDHIAWELGADDRDIAFFDALLAQLQSRYCIDENRIFVNGQSFGGLMTNAVGCLRGNVVRAIAVVAGSGPRASDCSGQVAAWLTHGVDDDSVSFSSGESSRDHWVAANGCSESTMTGTPAECLEYQGCDAGFPVIWCPHENDGGHQHPSFGREAVRNFLASF